MKRCIKCLHWKPVDDFYRRPDVKNGRSPYCKSCCNIARVQSAARRPDERRVYVKAYRQLEHVKEQRQDYQRVYRFRKRLRKARSDGARL